MWPSNQERVGEEDGEAMTSSLQQPEMTQHAECGTSVRPSQIVNSNMMIQQSQFHLWPKVA